MNIKIFLFLLCLIILIYSVCCKETDKDKNKEKEKDKDENKRDPNDWRNNSTFVGVKFGENLGGIEELIESLKGGPDPDLMVTIFALLNHSEESIRKQLDELTTDAFVSYTNQRFQHCWNVSMEIPKHVYIDVMRCSLEKVKDGMKLVVNELKTLTQIKDFIKDTVKNFKECEKNRKDFHKGKSKRAVDYHNLHMYRNWNDYVMVDADNSYQNNVSLLSHSRVKRSAFTWLRKQKQKVIKYKNKIIKFGSILTKNVGSRINVVKDYMEKGFKKMRTKMTSVAKHVFQKAKIVTKRILNVGKLTLNFIKTYYCFIDAGLTVRTDLEEIAKHFGMAGIFNPLVSFPNSTTIAEDFLDRYKPLKNLTDDIRTCVSDRLDNYSKELCVNGISSFSDPEDLEQLYNFQEVDDNFSDI